MIGSITASLSASLAASSPATSSQLTLGFSVSMAPAWQSHPPIPSAKLSVGTTQTLTHQTGAKLLRIGIQVIVVFPAFHHAATRQYAPPPNGSKNTSMHPPRSLCSRTLLGPVCTQCPPSMLVVCLAQILLQLLGSLQVFLNFTRTDAFFFSFFSSAKSDNLEKAAERRWPHISWLS